MKEFISNMKYINRLWSDLSWYIWGGTWTRANHTCELIDEFEKEHPFCGWLSRWRDVIVTSIACIIFLIVVILLCEVFNVQ